MYSRSALGAEAAQLLLDGHQLIERCGRLYPPTTKASSKADEGTRTLDLLHGKQTL
jgi:hypothetical protein